MTDEQPNPSSTDRPSRTPALDETLAPDNTDTASDGDFSTDAIPDSLGRYTIKKLLGRGGMGAVYLAHDSQLDRDIALKVPKFDAGTNEKSITRFYREARSAANLSHPNLCQVFDVGEIDGTHYIAMAFIKGRPLSDYVNEGKPPNSRVAAGIVRKVAAGMQEAHQSGIIHRDIKPANIMVDHRNEPIVMDFGLAVASENGTESRLTQDGALIGSPAYMSPEQLRGELDAIGPASDVYALGVVLYELLSGRLPFDGSGSTIAMIGQILTKQPAELNVIRPDLDSEIVAICNRAMSKEVADRFGSMKEFAAALTGYLKSNSASGGASQSSQSPKPGQTTKAGTKTVTVAQVQINEKAKLAKTLCDTKQFAAAVPILEQIIDSPDSEGSKALDYAQSILPKVKQQIAKQASAQVAAAKPAAPADDLFSSLPASTAPSTAAASTYRPPPARKRKAANKSGGMNMGLVAGVGAAVVAAGVGLAIAFWPPGTPPAVPNPPPSSDTSIATTAAPKAAATEADRDGMDSTNSTATNEPPLGGFRDRPNRGRQIDDFETDSNGDLVLSDLPGPIRNQFRIADRNDDGVLSKTEIDEMKRIDRQRRGGDERFPRDGGPRGPGGFDRPGDRPGDRPRGGPGGFGPRPPRNELGPE